MKTKLMMALSAFLMLFAMTSCNNGGDDTPDVYTDFMTLVSQTDNGCTLSVQRDMNSAPVTYTSTQKFGDKVKVGDRVVVAYTMDDGRSPYTSGPIRMLAYQLAVNGVIEWGSSSENDSWKTNSIQATAIWMTGNYLNFNILGCYVTEPKRFAVIADDSTMDDAMPTCYVIFLSDNEGMGSWKNFYASIDMSMIWNNMEYDGFILKYANDYNAQNQTLTFKRSEVIRPQE